MTVDPGRIQRLPGNVGDRLTVNGVPVLALDEPTYQLVPPLTTYCGIGVHKDVDCALAAILWRHPLILHGSCTEDILELVRTIHEHSIQKEFPFTQVDTVPTSDTEIEALCTKAGCGTIFLDLTKPFDLPPTLVRHLFSGYYHLWTLAVAVDAEDAQRCFGPRMALFPFYTIGFTRTSWHASMHDVTFKDKK
jgi:hypothetical protein